MKKNEKIYITFHTTTDALMTENLCRKLELTGKLVEVPRFLSAGCGLSWLTSLEAKNEILQVLKNNQINWDEVSMSKDDKY